MARRRARKGRCRRGNAQKSGAATPLTARNCAFRRRPLLDAARRPLVQRCLSLVPGLESTGRLPLILVNAVQYQCSLGQGTDQFRDKVFQAVWDEGGREDFARRMRKIYRTGDRLVCACTKGKMGTACELRALVYAMLRQEFPLANVLRRTHPSKWNIRRNREYEWEYGET